MMPPERTSTTAEEREATPAAASEAGRRVPFTLGGPRVIVAIDDDAYERFLPVVSQVVADIGLPFTCVRASELDSPHTESDLYFGAYVPSRPGCVRLFQTTALEIFEQAPSGAILRDGRQVWPEAPVATGRPRADVEGELVEGEDGALLFVTLPRLRVTATGPIFVLFQQPTLKFGSKVKVADWLRLARVAQRPDPRPS
jgi:hypothetical protein